MKIERIERARMSATLRVLILSGASGRERDRVGDDDLLDLRGRSRRSNAGPEKTPCVAAANTRVAPDSRTHPRGLDQRAGGVDHVVDEDRGLARRRRRPRSRPRRCCARAGSWSGRPGRTPSSPANFSASFARPASGETATHSSSTTLSRKYWVSIGRAIRWSTGIWKKPCTWPACRCIVSTRSAPAVSSIRATSRAEIGSRGSRLLVLARVAVPGRHGDDAVRRGALGRVDHQQQLHQVPVHRRVRRLDDEDVRAADRLQVAAVDLAVGEGLQLDAAERDPELPAILRAELLAAAAGEHHQPLVVGGRDARAASGSAPEQHRLASSSSIGRAVSSSRSRPSDLIGLPFFVGCLPLPLGVALDVRLAGARDPERARRARRP